MSIAPEPFEYRTDRSLESFSAQWDRMSYSVPGGTKGYPVMTLTDRFFKPADVSTTWTNKHPVSSVYEFRGDVRTFTSNYSTNTVTVDDLCYKLKQVKVVPTQYNNFRNVVVELFKLCDYDKVYVDGFIKADQYNPIIMAPGGSFNVWDYLNTLCAVHNVYMLRQNSNLLFLRDNDFLKEHMNNVTGMSYSVDLAQSTRTVKTTYRPMRYAYNEYLPLSKESKDTIIQVDARKTVEQTITLDAYVIEAMTPWVTQCKDYIPAKDTSGLEYTAYCVAGNDGLPITASQWLGQGGSLSVRLDPKNHNQIIVTVRGMVTSDYSPFRIAASSGPSNYYNSLRFRGTGLVMGPEDTYTTHTGSSTLGSDEEQINNPLINTPSLAVDNSLRAVWEKSGSIPTITLTSPNLESRTPSVTGNDLFLASGSAFDYGGDRFMTTHVDMNNQEITVTATSRITCDEFSNTIDTGVSLADYEAKIPKTIYNVFQFNQPHKEYKPE